MEPLFRLLVIFFLITGSAAAQKPEHSSGSVSSNSIGNTYLNTNNISTTISYDGQCDNSNGNAGFIFPKGSGKNLIFESGLLWGAKVEGDTVPYIGGSDYRSGLSPGRILPDGNPDNFNSEKIRIYRVRYNVYPGGPWVDLNSEINNENKNYSEIREEYEKDWTEWPADYGAPFVDTDSNGVYNPSIDQPGIKNAVQTVWFVTNDLDNSVTNWLYGSRPLGIEMQVTAWNYKSEGIWNNTLFRKYELINKSGSTLNEMYFQMFVDPDIGKSTDDLTGCDTLLNIGFSYNANETDSIFTPLPPAAVGCLLLQGPKVPGNQGQDINHNGIDDAADFAVFKNKLIGPGFINQPMTGFYANRIQGSSPHEDQTNNFTPEQTIAMYNLIKGLVGETGEPALDPTTNKQTRFPFYGDPISEKGWTDSLLQIYDPRFGVISGPVTFAPGDTQQVVYSFVAALGNDNIDGVKLVKEYSEEIKNDYEKFSLPINTTIPKQFELLQNFPNPFNSSTLIQYRLPESSIVKLSIYNILGEKVKTLENLFREKGIYDIQFDAASASGGLSSGVYFYRIEAGNFVDVKKMILLK